MTTTSTSNSSNILHQQQHQQHHSSPQQQRRSCGPLHPSHGNSPTPPPPPQIAGRFSTATIVHNNDMYLFGGGSSSTTSFNDLWRFDLSTRQWHRLLATGTYPTPKACASIVVHADRLILFGGWRHPSPNQPHHSWRLFNELHVFDIQKRSWTLIDGPTPKPQQQTPADASARTTPAPASAAVTANGPPPMTGHSVSVHGSHMIVFGGYQQRHSARANAPPRPPYHDEPPDQIDADRALSNHSNTLWSLNLETFCWRQIRTIGAARPSPRYGQHQYCLDDERLLIVGGCGGPNNMFSDAWVLNMRHTDQWQWQQVQIENRQWQATYTWCNPSCQVWKQQYLFDITQH